MRIRIIRYVILLSVLSVYASAIADDKDIERIFSIKKRIFYRGRSRRDPFSWPKLGIADGSRLDVTSLTLVGVIRYSDGWKIIVKDREGNDYLLRLGDRVRNGVISSISDSKVIFTLKERGRNKLFELKLTGKSEEEEGTINIQVRTGEGHSSGPTPYNGSESWDTLYIVSPKRGQAISQNLTFRWASPSSEDLRYDLSIYELGIPIFVKKGLRSNVYEFEDLSLLPEMVSLYWKVRATDSRGNQYRSSEDNSNFYIIRKDDSGLSTSEVARP